MAHYIPPYMPPCENYWQSMLDEGDLSRFPPPGLWEWTEFPDVGMDVWEAAEKLHHSHTVMELIIDDYNRGGLIAHWKGIECFVPASHLLDYPFPADPVAREERFKEYLNQELRLCIIEVEPTRNRILLSERQVADCEPEEPEWPDWLCPGNVCQGTVTSVRPFGAFVDIGPLEGMVHISEISWGRVRHPEDFVSPGDEVEVLVLNVDLENQRVGLSLKRLKENPWLMVEQHIQPGDVLTGEVVSVEKFGVFIELVDGLEGLLHISEVDHCRSAADLQAYYDLGDAVPVRVLDIMPDEHRIALGRSDVVDVSRRDGEPRYATR